MSEAKKCDRCGAFYQPSCWADGDIAINRKIKKYESILFCEYYFVDDGIDLCPGCTAFIKDWLTKKEN